MTRPEGSGAAGAPDGADTLLRFVSGLLALVGGFLAALLSVLLVPLRVEDLWPLGYLLTGPEPDPSGIGPVRAPLAVLIAPAVVLALTWFARAGTGVRWAVLLPAVGWFGMVLLVLTGTAEGDQLLLANDWVAALTLFGGTTVLVVTVVTGLTGGPARARSPEPGSRNLR